MNVFKGPGEVRVTGLTLTERTRFIAIAVQFSLTLEREHTASNELIYLGLSKKLLNTFRREGDITRVSDLCDWTPAQLMALTGVGKGTVASIERRLRERNMSLKKG